MIPSNPSLYRPDIDGLRAFAVISVFLFHLDVAWFPGGFVGVDIFFVISGFLITGLIKKEIENTGKFCFGAFYMRRVRRLFPALFLVLLLTAAVATLLFSTTHLSRFGGAFSSAFVSVSNIYFWVEADYFDVSANIKPLLHTWSLSVEEQFYLFWPLLLLLLIKMHRDWLIPALLLLIGVMSLEANIYYGSGTDGAWNEDGKSTIFFLLPFRIFEFVIGALLVWCNYRLLKVQWLYEVLFLLGVVLMLYAVLMFNENMLFPSYFALVPSIGTALVIYTGNRAASARVLTNPVTVGIGLISYSLYLVHWPLIVFWQYFMQGELGWGDQAIISVLSITFAYTIYRFVEQPFLTKQIDITAPIWRNSLITATVVFFVVGLHIKASGGWVWRISSPAVVDYSGDPSNFHKTFYGGAGYPYFGAVNTQGKPDIVVMGDSHGRHYAEGIFKVLAEPNNLKFYNASGTSCFHLPNFTKTTEGKDWKKLCHVALNKAISFVRQGNSPVVIISHSWINQMSVAGQLDAEGNLLDKKISTDTIIEGILELKNRIGDSPLVVIGIVPGTGGHNLYDIFSRPTLPFFTWFEPDAYLTAKAKTSQMIFNESLRKAAEETGQFIFLDPHNVLCGEGVCRNLDDKKRLIYSDTSHLSKYGSIEVIKGFLPVLQKIISLNNNVTNI